MTNITDQNFNEEVLKSDSVVLVDCYADWCGPCKALKPMLVNLAAKSNGKVKLGLLDVESNPDLTTKLSVTSIPKVVVFKGGEKITEIIGIRAEADYQDIVDGL